MAQNIANVLVEQGVRPDPACAITLLNCVEIIAYFLVIVLISPIAAPTDIDIELIEVARALRTLKRLRRSCYQER